MTRAAALSARDLLARVHLRLILFAVVLTAASLTLSGALAIRDHAQRNLALVAEAMALRLEQAVARHDPAAIRAAISAAQPGLGIQQIEVRNAAGHLLESWRNPRASLPGWALDLVNHLSSPAQALGKVVRGGVEIGTVRVSGNPEELLRFALAGLIIGCSTLMLTVIAARILTRELQRDVVGPLEHVAQLAHAVRTRRAFDHRVPQAGVAEIERFGRDFNALLAELQGWHGVASRDHAALAERVLLDPLTGLGNCAAFEVALSDAVAQAVGAGRSFAVLRCAITDLGAIMSQHGAAAGDQTLGRVAGRLRTVLRQDDQAFRLGEDSFAVLLGAAGGSAAGGAIAARLEQAMTAPLALGDGLTVSASLAIEIVTYPDDGLSPHALLRRVRAARQAVMLADAEQ